MHWMVVDLPAPLGPKSPKHSPWATSKEISDTAWTSVPWRDLYRLLRWATWRGAGERGVIAWRPGSFFFERECDPPHELRDEVIEEAAQCREDKTRNGIEEGNEDNDDSGEG